VRSKSELGQTQFLLSLALIGLISGIAFASNFTFNQTNSTNKTPFISLYVTCPEKVIRGEEFDVKVNLTNFGFGEATDIRISVELPNGLRIIGREGDCIALKPFNSCQVLFRVKSSVSTKLGRNHIKIKVSYEG